MAHSRTPSSMSGKQKVKPRADTPFPLKQLLILSLARFAEPIAFMSIFPYCYYMIRSFNITDDDRQISVYAGMVTSSFAIAECSCSAMWGRLSDRVGRKPVLLVGLGGTGISMLTFGFATNLKVALAARFVGGLLNGNGGVLQTMVAEVVTVPEHQPRAYTFLPLTWGLGSVIGSFLGGTLADPVHNLPGLFPAERWPILVSFPFLLPNLFAAAMVIFGMLVATLFFHETHPSIRYQRDRGIELGDWLVRLVTWSTAPKSRPAHLRHKAKRSDATGSVDLSNHDEEAEGLLDDDMELTESPSASTPTRSPRRSKFDSPMQDEKEDVNSSFSPAKPAHISVAKTAPASTSVRAAFTPQVILNILAYGILAFHTIALDQLLPVFFSLPPASEPQTSLIHFTGGLGLTPLAIGWIFSGQAIYSMFFQVLLAPPLIRSYGYTRIFQLSAFTWALLYFLIPYITFLPPGSLASWAAITAICVWKTSIGSLAYLTILILITNTVKEAGQDDKLGSVNGVSASFASGARAVGPTVAGWLFNVGEQAGVAGLVWWLVAGVALIGWIESFWMREPGVRQAAGELQDDDANLEEDDDDRTLFSESDDDEGGETRKEKIARQEQEELEWIRGEQEGQAEAGLGAPRALGSGGMSMGMAVGVVGELVSEGLGVKKD